MTRIKFVLLIVVVLVPIYQGLVPVAGTTSTSWNNFYINSSSLFNFQDMAIDSSDNIIIVGGVSGNNLPGNSSAKISGINGGIIKLDSHGSLVWSKYFGASKIENFHRVVVDSANNIIILGLSYSKELPFTYNYTIGPKPNDYYTNFLVKYSPSGTILWTTLYRNTLFGQLEDMLLGPNDSIILTQGNYTSLATAVFEADGTINLARSSIGYFNTFYHRAFGTSTGEVYKLGESVNTFSSEQSSYILTKYDTDFSKEWSINMSSIVPSIYIYHVQVLPNNNLFFFGSFDNSNTTAQINYFSDVNLGLYCIYIDSNGSIIWKNLLYLTGGNYYQSLSYNNISHETMIVGDTLNKLVGQGDIIFNILPDNGSSVQWSLLGGSGAETVFDSKINHQGYFIIVTYSYIQHSLDNYKLIIFAVNSNGVPIEPVSFANAPKIDIINNIIGLTITACVILFALAIFNIYVSYFVKSTNEISHTRNKRKKKPKHATTFSYVNCPHDGTRMRTYVTRNNPNSEFLVTNRNIDVGLSNAVAMKKIPLFAVDTIKGLVLDIFDRYTKLNDVILQTLECPECQFISANPVSIPYEDRYDYVQTTNSNNEDKLSYIHSPSLTLSINPFPSLEIIKGYFKSILTFNKDDLREYSKEPEATKLTSFAIVLNALLPFQFSNGAYFSAELGLNIAVYFLLIFLSGFLIIGLLNTKKQDFKALDNFRLWGIILWFNVPILALVYGISTMVDSNITIATYSINLLVDNARIILLLVFYGITVTKLTQLSKTRSTFATLIIFLVVSYLIGIYMVLGLVAMYMLGLLSFFGVFILCMFVNRKDRLLKIRDL